MSTKNRISSDDVHVNSSDANNSANSSALIGVASDESTFIVPRTKPTLEIHHPREWDFVDWLRNASIGYLLLLLTPIPKWFFAVLFIFWRLCYNVGIGYLLDKQSKERFLSKLFEKYSKHPTYAPILKKLCSMGMGPDYDFEKLPADFNTWLLYRLLVDLILTNDLSAYITFALAYWEFPEQINLYIILCYLTGIVMCGFALWAKVESYKVVKDFAWYWGDFFFLVKQSLTFDRVFSISPHPMYTIGYTFFYGASLISQSHTVLYISLFGHFLQLAFLAIVENPHIEKTYPGMVEEQDVQRRNILYDKATGYFRKDLIIFYHLDIFRSSDLFMVLLIAYCVILNFFDLPLWFYLGHALFWRIILNVGLGSILWLQSKTGFWTNHFVKNGYTKHNAFENWKGIYNLVLAVTHTTFVCFAIKWARLEFHLLQDTFGLLLISLNMWSSVSTFEVLGEFGWYFGDFFIDEVPSVLYYSGIYRFLNNPDSVTGFAGYYGVALLSDNVSVLLLAMFSQALHAIFVRYVEEPHMKKLYGNKKREVSGISQAVNIIASEVVEKSPLLQRGVEETEKLKEKLKKSVEPVAQSLKERIEPVAQRVQTVVDELVKKNA